MSGYNKNKKTPSQRLIINTIRTFITCYNDKEIYFSIAITRDVEESKKKDSFLHTGLYYLRMSMMQKEKVKESIYIYTYIDD